MPVPPAILPETATLLAERSVVQRKSNPLVSQGGKCRVEQSQGEASTHAAHVGDDRPMGKHGKDVCLPQFLSQMPTCRLHRLATWVGKIHHRVAVAHDEQRVPFVGLVLTQVVQDVLGRELIAIDVSNVTKPHCLLRHRYGESSRTPLPEWTDVRDLESRSLSCLPGKRARLPTQTEARQPASSRKALPLLTRSGRHRWRSPGRVGSRRRCTRPKEGQVRKTDICIVRGCMIVTLQLRPRLPMKESVGSGTSDFSLGTGGPLPWAGKSPDRRLLPPSQEPRSR